MTRNPTRSAGFTLVEVLVSVSIGAVVMAAALSAYIFLGRNLARLSSYRSLESESRKALAYLTRDFTQALKVKNGTTPTEAQVTLVLPSGEVSYTYSSGTKTLRRQSTFGASMDFKLLRTESCECTTFQFRYFTAEDGPPTDQLTAATNVPFSIKQIQVHYVIESPATWNSQSRTRFEIASSRHIFRNRGATDGS